MFSVVILTLNEEKALPDCLATLGFCDDIVVLDSGSTDRTKQISLSAGARFFTRAFDNFAGQRNYAQNELQFKHQWVFHLDADERFTPELLAECLSAEARTGIDGFRVSPKMMFEGRWVRHCTDYPAYQARFVRAPHFQFIQVGHGQRENPAMVLENLRESYLHDISIYGVDSWIEKHRRYAAQEALAMANGFTGVRLVNLISSDRLLRRRALKQYTSYLPLRALFRFIYQYILRRGFLDGTQGLTYCLLLSKYEGFISAQLKAIRRSRKN